MSSIWAQSMVEYGALSTVAATVASLWSRLELSLREDRGEWLLGGALLVIVLWLFRRR